MVFFESDDNELQLCVARWRNGLKYMKWWGGVYPELEEREHATQRSPGLEVPSFAGPQTRSPICFPTPPRLLLFLTAKMVFLFPSVLCSGSLLISESSTHCLDGSLFSPMVSHLLIVSIPTNMLFRANTSPMWIVSYVQGLVSHRRLSDYSCLIETWSHICFDWQSDT